MVPIFDASGRVVEIYGRKITRNLRPGTPLHLYLPGPHAGVWNEPALAASKEIILCEALLDALTFWCAGFRNVTAAYGVEGFTADHGEAFRRHGTERVLLAYDRDEAGDRAAEALAAKLAAAGIGCYRVQFPRGMDANEYALRVTPAAKSLGLALRRAAWMGGGSAPAALSSARAVALSPAEASRLEPPAGAAAAAADLFAACRPPRRPRKSSSEGRGGQYRPCRCHRRAGRHRCSELAAVSPLAAAFSTAVPATSPTPATLPAPPASPLPLASPPEVPAEIKSEEVVLRLGDRRYRVRGLAKNLSYDSLKINLLAGRGETSTSTRWTSTRRGSGRPSRRRPPRSSASSPR